MRTMNIPFEITISCDSVTFHEWNPDPAAEELRRLGVFGAQIGERTPTNNEGVVISPIQMNKICLHAALLLADEAMTWTEPLWVDPGEAYSVTLPAMARVS